MYATPRPPCSQPLAGLVRADRQRDLRDRARVGMRLGLRLTAAWHSMTLDRQLADGADSQSSAVLAFRARQLTGPRGRCALAAGLAGALRSAGERRSGLTAALRPDASELLDARVVVAALERRLRSTEPLAVQGVAMVSLLLTDATSPLYRPSAPGALASRLRAAAAALEPFEHPAEKRSDLTRGEFAPHEATFAPRQLAPDEVGR